MIKYKKIKLFRRRKYIINFNYINFINNLKNFKIKSHILYMYKNINFFFLKYKINYLRIYSYFKFLQKIKKGILFKKIKIKKRIFFSKKKFDRIKKKNWHRYKLIFRKKFRPKFKFRIEPRLQFEVPEIQNEHERLNLSLKFFLKKALKYKKKFKTKLLKKKIWNSRIKLKMIYKYINIDKNRKNALNKLFKNNLIMNLPFKKFFFKVRAKRYIIPKTLFFKYKLSSVKVGFKKRHPKLYISKYKISKYKISKYKISKYKISKYKISKYKKK